MSGIEIVEIRDPDGVIDTLVWVDGEELPPEQYELHVLDAGRGWTAEDWHRHVDHVLATSSPGLAQRLTALGVRFDPPGREYIRGL